MAETEKTTALIKRDLAAGTPENAERRLHALAVRGDVDDTALMEIVADLDDYERTRLIGAGDVTKPSLVATLLTPEQFIEALERIGSKWTKVSSYRKDSHLIDRYQGELADFILSVILSAKDDPNRIASLFSVFQKKKYTHVLMALMPWDLEFMDDFDHNMVVDNGTVAELVPLMKEYLPHLLQIIQTAMIQEISLHQKPGEDRQDASERLHRKYMRETLNSLVKVALGHAKVAPKSSSADGVWGNL